MKTLPIGSLIVALISAAAAWVFTSHRRGRPPVKRYTICGIAGPENCWEVEGRL